MTEEKAGMGSRILQNHGAPAVQRFQPNTCSKYADLSADLVRAGSKAIVSSRKRLACTAQYVLLGYG